MNMQRVHLGIPLLNPRMSLDYQIGYRYWAIDEQGRLGAPISAGQNWAPGLNKKACKSGNCKKGDVEGCGCGLYAWKHNGGKEFCCAQYFVPSKALVNNANKSNLKAGKYFIVGAVVLFGPNKAQHAEMVVTKFGAVAAIAPPPKPDKEMQKRIKLACEFYGVDLVSPDKLHQAAENYLKQEKLSSYYIKPAPKSIYAAETFKDLAFLATAQNLVLQTDFKKKRKQPTVPAYNCELAVAGSSNFAPPIGYQQKKTMQIRAQKIYKVASDAHGGFKDIKEVCEWRTQLKKMFAQSKMVRVSRGGIFVSQKNQAVFAILKAQKDADLDKINQTLYGQVGGSYIDLQTGWVKDQSSNEYASVVYPPNTPFLGFVALKKIPKPNQKG